VRAIDGTTGQRWDRSKVAFAALLAGLVGVSGAAVALLDNLYLKPYAQQAHWAAACELAAGAERASQLYVRGQLAGMSDLCAQWAGAAGLGTAPGKGRLAEWTGNWVPEEVARKDLDAAWLTDLSGRVVGVWTRPTPSGAASILDPAQFQSLARGLAHDEARDASGLCKLGTKLSFFASKPL
jgi:hypothetical protein